MIYSRWRPDTGGYDYFESPERFALGGDLPVPRLFATNAIGVASVDVGRTPPSRARAVGSGAVARGLVMPVSRVGLSGLGFVDQVPTWLIGLAGLVAGLFIGREVAK